MFLPDDPEDSNVHTSGGEVALDNFDFSWHEYSGDLLADPHANQLFGPDPGANYIYSGRRNYIYTNIWSATYSARPFEV